MAENQKHLGRQLALLRLIPIIVLVIIAFVAQYVFGLDRLWAAGVGLVAAVLLRYALIRLWK